MSDIETKRAANRAAFPCVAAMVDEVRDLFGDGVRVDGGCEDGRSFGVNDPFPEDSPKVFSGDRLVFASTRVVKK